jgi:magnesium-transporting ATPase (P-type)
VEDVQAALDAGQLLVDRRGVNEDTTMHSDPTLERSSVTNTACLVVDGHSLYLMTEEQKTQLMEIATKCRSVVACRTSPAQKASLVSMVKDHVKPTPVTLGIGDGANDVGMVQTADVGVGIIGKEGRQAANAADFAIGQFRYLKRLLMLHGRWNYMRQSNVFLYSVHKNMVITFTLFWYSYFTAVSGTSLYESLVYTSFNFVLGLPIIFYGFLNQDISASTLRR